jgi:diacylglycerol kinase (ATP)
LTRELWVRQHDKPVAQSAILWSESPAVVFVNPAAGGGRAGSILPSLRKLFKELHFPAEFVLTESAEELEARARQAIAQEYRLLFAMGGDGTFQGLLNAAFGANVVLGVLPAGGGNDFAAALGLPGHPLQAAELVLQGQVRDVDLVRARTANGRERFYAGGGGVGLDAEAAQHARCAYRRLPGRFRYLASALRALLEFTPVEVRVEFPDSDLQAMEAKSLLVGVLNTPSYGAGLRLAPEAKIDDGWLNLVLMEDLSVFGVLTLLPRLMGSGELRTTRVQRRRAKRIRLETDRPRMFHGDGEILGPTPVEIEVACHAVRVLSPVAR